jgi:hypothetical protein
MWANSVWGLFGLAAACVLTRLTMGVSNSWVRVLNWSAGICLAAALIVLIWPLFVGKETRTPEVSIKSENQSGGQTAHTIVNNNETHVVEHRDPNAIYQFNSIVGSVQGAVIAPERSQISFQFVRLSTQVDPNREFEYQDWSLECHQFPEPRAGFVATYSAALSGATCRIMGNAGR